MHHHLHTKPTFGDGVICTQPEPLSHISFANFSKENHSERHRYDLEPNCLPLFTLSDCSNSNRKASDLTSPTEGSTSDEDSSPDTDGKGDNSESEASKDQQELRCCLMCACFECCACCDVPNSYDAVYYAIQRQTQQCPNGCPTIVPRPEEEEWTMPSGYGKEFACSPCCGDPGCIICLKYADCLLCPLLPLWDICKGIDHGYRRFRVQLILDRYADSHKKRYISCL
ncbi:unnamed protein product [Dicrocoelium dendriticum]|nr:unnamed protein product [Dicrocoelium dendriticum]